MKLKHFLFLGLSAIVFTGCSDDDSPTSSPTNCSTLGSDVENAIDAWTADYTNKTLCEAAAGAQQLFVDGGCDEDGSMEEAVRSTTEACESL